MTKHAILIGINTIPDLEYLSSPSTYAIKMKNWAQGQGYITSLFVDEPGTESTAGACSRSDILSNVRDIVNNGTDQLLIYFAGHGYERAPGEDIWLLPQYNDDTSEAISVSSCRNLAYRSGINHVVFISDACRSINSLPSIHQITPGTIFPIVDMNSRVDIDTFYSVYPGSTSIDVRDENGDYKSIYSDNLLKCLEGSVTDVIREVKTLQPTFPAVLSAELNEYLKTKVHDEIYQKTGYKQLPMGNISSSDPLYLSRFDEQGLVETIGRTAIALIPDKPSKALDTSSVSEKLDSLLRVKGGFARARSKDIMRNFKQDYEFFTSDIIFPDRITGLLVTGLSKPVVLSNRFQDFENNYSKRNFAVPQLLSFDNDDEKSAIYFVPNRGRKRFYPISILPGYFTQVVFRNNEVLTVNYFPTDASGKHDARFHVNEVAERKANIIMAAKNGIFQGSHELNFDGGYYRSFKHLEPTLGLFAAYAYFQSGDFSGVRSLYHYLVNSNQSILGDIALLYKLSQRNFDGLNTEGIPMPLLTQGWSYLDLLEQHPLKDLVRHLQTGLWTSFDRDGFEKINDNFRTL